MLGFAYSWSLPDELIRERPRPIRHDIASVLCRHCFNQHDPAFLFGDRIVQDALRYNAEFPWKHGDFTPALELDHEASLDNLKELVFVIVFVLCHTSWPFSLATLMYWSFTRPTTFGDQ
jgi:hypothetical protein